MVRKINTAFFWISVQFLKKFNDQQDGTCSNKCVETRIYHFSCTDIAEKLEIGVGKSTYQGVFNAKHQC